LLTTSNRWLLNTVDRRGFQSEANCFGSQTPDGKQVFEGNTFRLERQDNNVTVTAKDGRGAIASLKEGQLNGDLTPKDVEKFQAVDRQLNQGQSRQFQAEIG